MRHRNRKALLAAMFVVALAGCSDSTPLETILVTNTTTPTPVATVVETAPASTDESADANGATTDTPDSAAIVERTAQLLLGGYTTETAQQALDSEQKTQALIATCMNAAGFDWIEWTFELKDYEGFIATSLDTINWIPDNTADPSYGIVVGYRKSLAADFLSSAITPNDEIRASLSSTNRTEYDAALYGELGCGSASADAVRAAFADPTGLPPPDDELLGRLRQQLISSDAVTDLFGDWSACMETRGYQELSEPFDLYGYFDTWIGQASTTASARENTAGDIEVTVTNQRELSNLQTEERALATTDFSCRRSTRYSERLSAEARAQAKFAARALGWL